MRLVLLMLCLIVAQPVLSATITGVVYDLSLQEVTTATVSISSDQEQRMITKKDGSYSFEVPSGTYRLIAKANLVGGEWKSEENISVRDEGRYVMDMVLEPTFSAEENLDLNEPAPDDIVESTSVQWWLILGLLAVAVPVFALIFLASHRRIKKHDPEVVAREDDFKAEVLRIIRESEGRITQKEITKKVRFSMAKVSLVVSELESEGMLKKVKKGRGNILILKGR